MNMEKIDFVLPWVDDASSEWNAARRSVWQKVNPVDPTEERRKPHYDS